jgi:hypothetical protein
MTQSLIFNSILAFGFLVTILSIVPGSGYSHGHMDTWTHTQTYYPSFCMTYILYFKL